VPADGLVEAVGLPTAASPTIDEVMAPASGAGDPSLGTTSEAAAPTVVVVSGVGALLMHATSIGESWGPRSPALSKAPSALGAPSVLGPIGVGVLLEEDTLHNEES
jgi:hypothetical protein